MKAGVFESRIGVTKQLDKDYLRLDIGASPEIIAYTNKQNLFSFGVDFFTFSNLRSESNFKFPVDAIDYLFGVNFNYRRDGMDKIQYSSRLRISHISSHFEDGHIYENTDTIFTPVVYSREFIDLAGMADFIISERTTLKMMLGLNYMFHTIPDKFGRVSMQYGFEAEHYLNGFLMLYLSNELRYARVNDKGNFNESLEAGIRIGSPRTRAVRFFFAYYDGQDYKGQYYDKYLNYKALGFNVEL
jgi:hypothetical protein